MVVLDREEAEQISKLKYFIQDWGKYLVLALIIIAIGYGADSYWNWHQQKIAKEGAAFYQNFVAAVKTNDIKSIYKANEEMQKSYPSLEYTAMAAMQTARTASEHNDLSIASANLQFIIANCKDKGLVSVASLNLVDIYIDQHNYKQALKLLLQKHDKTYDVLYYIKRGDLHLVRGNLAEARLSYQEALKLGSQDQTLSQMVEMRLASIGGN